MDRAPRPPDAKVEVLIEDSLWVERGWVQRIWNNGVHQEEFACAILEELDGLWEPHRGFRGRPDFERLTARVAGEGVGSSYGSKSQRIHKQFQKGRPLHSLKVYMTIFERFESNFAYLNLYASGDARIAKHSDTQNMPQLGEEPTIMCVSFGASRRFRMHRNEPEKYGEKVVETTIDGGDLYVMHGRSQAEWRHELPRDPGAGPRLSATFRNHR